MNTILSALLVLIGMGLLIVLVFIGYLLFTNQTAKEKFIANEAELAEIVSTLEKMLSDTDEFLKNTKLEISEAKADLLLLKEDIIKLKENLELKEDEKKVVNKKASTKKENKVKTLDSNKENLILQEAKISTDKVLKIRTLYNEGVSVSEIAKTLEMGKGEVELILNLKR